MLFTRMHVSTRRPILQALGTGIVDNKRCSNHTLHVGSNIKPADVELWVDCRMMICAFALICK
jgi:hypothetical protein